MQNILRIVAFVFLLAFCHNSHAAKIIVPAQIEPYKPIEFIIQTEGDKKPSGYLLWVTSSGEPVEFRPDLNDAGVFRGTGTVYGPPGKYTFMAGAFFEGGTVEQCFATTVIGPPAPTPVPPGPTPPGPVPPGPSPVPDGVHGLTRWAYDLAALVPLPSRALAAGVSDNLQGVASAADAGTVNDVQVMFDLLIAKNKATLESDRAAWTPFGLAFKAKLDSLVNTGKINGVGELAIAYRAIADGMRQAALLRSKK